MYYQKESKNINNDYYNAYVEHSNRVSDTNDILSTIIKVLAIIFLLTLIIFGYIFVSNQYYLSQVQAKEVQQQRVLVGVNTIESVTDILQKQNKKLSSEDITQIVQMVILKMNSQKVSSINDDSYAKILIENGKNREDSVDVKVTNHYNKVVIKRNERDKNRDAISSLHDEIATASANKKEEKYKNAISKELNVRENAMRIIVVKEGDTLSTIARKAYGNVNAYKKIYEANPEVIKNQDKIFTGQKIRIPK